MMIKCVRLENLILEYVGSINANVVAKYICTLFKNKHHYKYINMENTVFNLLFYLMFWAMFRIIIHANKSSINEMILFYKPRWVTDCLICIWYNLGLIETFIHFIIIKYLIL